MDATDTLHLLLVVLILVIGIAAVSLHWNLSAIADAATLQCVGA